MSATTSERGRLLQVLGVAFGLAVTLGSVIGAGILRTPGDIARLLPSGGLFIGVWILGGLYALIGANALAELGAMIPRSGGQYVFARRALGPYAGFVVGWSDWVSTCASVAAGAILARDYLGALLPSIAGRDSVALGIVAVFALVQWRGVRWGDRAQQVTSFVKAIAFVLLVIASFGHAPAAAVMVPVAPEIGLGAALILAMQSVIYTYDGWTGPIYFSEEMKEPGRDVPRSMLIGVVSVMMIYLAINGAFLHLLGIGGMAGEEFVAGKAAQQLFGAEGDRVIRSLMVVSLASNVNANTLMATRVLFSMSRDQLFFSAGARVNRGGTPTVTLLLGALVTGLFILTGSFEKVIAVAAFFFVASYVVSFSSVFVLRAREPSTLRPYRAFGHPVTTGLILAGSVAFLIGALASDTQNSVVAVVVLALSYPIYRLIAR